MKTAIIVTIAIVITAIASASLVCVTKVNPVTEKIEYVPTYERETFGNLTCSATYKNDALEIHWEYTGVFRSNNCVGVIHIPFINISYNGTKYPMSYIYVPDEGSNGSTKLLDAIANDTGEHTWSCYVRLSELYLGSVSYLDGTEVAHENSSDSPLGFKIGLSELDDMGIIYGTMNQNHITAPNGGTEYSVTLSTIETATWFEKQTNGTINIGID